MSRSLRAVIVLAAGLGLVACKKEAPPESVPVAVSGQPTAVDPAPAAPADAADAGAEGGTGDGGVAVPTPTGVQPPVRNQSVDACCAALASAQSKEPRARIAERKAAQICAGVSGRVKSGETSRAAGLTLIRGSLAGAPTPPACR